MNISTFSLIFLSLLGVQSIVHVLAEWQGVRGYPSFNRNEYLTHNRERRAILPLTKKGLDAVNVLTRGATELLGADKVMKVFQKSGTYSTALKDFKSVKPTSVTKFDLPGGNKGYLGSIGDRTIFVEKRGKGGRPMIRIVRHGDRGDGGHMITYVDDGKNWLTRWF